MIIDWSNGDVKYYGLGYINAHVSVYIPATKGGVEDAYRRQNEAILMVIIDSVLSGALD